MKQTSKKRNLRTGALQKKRGIQTGRRKDVLTSASLPNWNQRRVEAMRQRLRADLKEAGIESPVSEGEIEQLCLKLLLTNMPRNPAFKPAAVQYNDKCYSYHKVNLQITHYQDYFMFRAKRNHLRASVSYLLDIALRLYLRLAVRLIYLQLTGAILKAKWNKFFKSDSNYYENISSDDCKCLKFSEQVKFFADSS